MEESVQPASRGELPRRESSLRGKPPPHVRGRKANAQTAGTRATRHRRWYGENPGRASGSRKCGPASKTARDFWQSGGSLRRLSVKILVITIL